jgi:hypothetical protein
MVLGWRGGSDPEVVRPLFHSSFFGKSPVARIRFKDEPLDQLLVQGARELDRARRQAIYREVQQNEHVHSARQRPDRPEVPDEALGQCGGGLEAVRGEPPGPLVRQLPPGLLRPRQPVLLDHPAEERLVGDRRHPSGQAPTGHVEICSDSPKTGPLRQEVDHRRGSSAQGSLNNKHERRLDAHPGLLRGSDRGRSRRVHEPPQVRHRHPDTAAEAERKREELAVERGNEGSSREPEDNEDVRATRPGTPARTRLRGAATPASQAAFHARRMSFTGRPFRWTPPGWVRSVPRWTRLRRARSSGVGRRALHP